jgi:hypothetical protein
VCVQMCVCVCVCFCVCVCLCVYPASTIILLCKNQHVFAMASSAHTHEHAPRTQTRCNSQGTKCDENVRMRTSQIPYYYLSSINTTSPHKYARAVRAHTHTHTHTHTQTHTARAYSQRVHAFLTICFFHRTHYRLRAAAHIFLPTFFFVFYCYTDTLPAEQGTGSCGTIISTTVGMCAARRQRGVALHMMTAPRLGVSLFQKEKKRKRGGREALRCI